MKILKTALCLFTILLAFASSCKPEGETDYRDKWCGEWGFTTCLYEETWSTNPFDTVGVTYVSYDTITWDGSITKSGTDRIRVQFRPIDCSVQTALEKGYEAGYVELDADRDTDTLRYQKGSAPVTGYVNTDEAYLSWTIIYGHAGYKGYKVYGIKNK